MIEYYINYRKKQMITVTALVIGLLAAVFFYIHEKEAVNIQQGIAKEVIRFHVLANSDTQQDQSLKLEVRDLVLTELEKELTNCDSVDESRRIIREQLNGLEQLAQRYVWDCGYAYPVTAEFVKDDFPEKTYGDCTFPAGEYEALRINIGNAKGHNWWCMVYPGLCFTEETGAYVSEENKTMLKHVLTEEEYDHLTKANRITIRFRWLDLELFDLF